MTEPFLMPLRRRGGRPPRSTGPSTARVEFMVTPEERAALATVARENNVPLATVVRDAVNTYVQDYREDPVFRRTKALTRP